MTTCKNCDIYFLDRRILQEDCTNGNLRLANPLSENSGRIEICMNRAWGTICDSAWQAQDNAVACRQLGYQPYGM